MSTAPLAEVEAALVAHFGQAPLRASVSFLGVEPIEVLRFEPVPDERALLTLGMSRHPMTSAASDLLAVDGPRAELVLHVRDGAHRFDDVWRALALLAAAPAVEGVVYTPGMTVDTGAPLAPASRCTGGVVTESPWGDLPTSAGPVTVLQLLPATQNELAYGRVQGSAALRERWREQGTDLLDLARGPVALG